MYRFGFFVENGEIGFVTGKRNQKGKRGSRVSPLLRMCVTIAYEPFSNLTYRIFGPFINQILAMYQNSSWEDVNGAPDIHCPVTPDCKRQTL
jgi:hypothetical protein